MCRCVWSRQVWTRHSKSRLSSSLHVAIRVIAKIHFRLFFFFVNLDLRCGDDVVHFTSSFAHLAKLFTIIFDMCLNSPLQNSS